MNIKHYILYRFSLIITCFTVKMEEQDKNLQDSAENVEQLQSKLSPLYTLLHVFLEVHGQLHLLHNQVPV